MYALARQSPLLCWRSSTRLSKSTISSLVRAACAERVAPPKDIATASAAATSARVVVVVIALREVTMRSILDSFLQRSFKEGFSPEVLHRGHRLEPRGPERGV